MDMLIRALQAEGYKLKGGFIWAALLGMPVIPAVMGTYNYLGNLEILQNEWYSLWTQHTLFTCYFFLPALMGVGCAYLCRLEHVSGSWNTLLASPLPEWTVYGAKLLWSFIMAFVMLAVSGVLYVVSGKLAGLSGQVPAELAWWLGRGLLGGLTVCAAQLFLALLIRSFAVPVAAGLVGGIAGVVVISQGGGLLFPYALTSIGMGANDPAGSMLYSGGQYVGSCLMFTLVFAALGIFVLRNRRILR